MASESIDEMREYSGPSCTSNGCVIRKPGGMGTNGVCRCADYKGTRYIKWLEEQLSLKEVSK